MIRSSAFPGCCTAYIIYNFPYDRDWEESTNEELKKDLDRIINNTLMITYTLNGYSSAAERIKHPLKRKHKIAVLIGICNSNQKHMATFLKKFGFQESRWMYKMQHPDTQDKVFYLELNPIMQPKSVRNTKKEKDRLQRIINNGLREKQQ